jgi:hypothetical protein
MPRQQRTAWDFHITALATHGLTSQGQSLAEALPRPFYHRQNRHFNRQLFSVNRHQLLGRRR